MEYTRLLALLQKTPNPKIAFTYAQKLQICFEYSSKAPKLLKILQILNNLKNYFTNLISCIFHHVFIFCINQCHYS